MSEPKKMFLVRCRVASRYEGSDDAMRTVEAVSAEEAAKSVAERAEPGEPIKVWPLGEMEQFYHYVIIQKAKW
jgi:hypothetical protein